MKILILANNDMGLYNFRKELLERLVSEKYEVVASLPDGDRIKDIKEIGCKVIITKVDRHSKNPFKDFALLNKYKKIIREEKPNLILTYTVKPNIYGGIVAQKYNIPYIENITGLGKALENEGLIQKIIIKLYKKALKKAQCCFIQNEDNLKFVKEKIGYNDIYKLIPGSGVNLEKFNVLPYPKENEKLNFLFISRIMKEKGIDIYIEVAKQIKEKYKNTEFYVIGPCDDENYKEKLKKLNSDGIIKYEGKQNDIIPYLKISCCTIHPSYYPEGMSNVLLESCSSGRPIITTDRSGCMEIVDNKKTGYVVPIKDEQATIEAVKKFIQLSYEEKIKMGERARKKVEIEFDRNMVINEYLRKIKEIERKIIN